MQDKPDNARVLPFNPRPKPETENGFDSLAKKLETKIANIERELKDSIHILESDVQRLVKRGKGKADQADIKDDLATLSKTLEGRIKGTLDGLLKESRGKNEREELKALRGLSSHLMQVLTVDFYKNILEKVKPTETNDDIDEFGMEPAMVERFRPLLDFLYEKYWRVETTGINNIPDKGRALIVANHSGTLPYDGAMIKAAVLKEHQGRKDARFLVEDFVFHMPFLGGLMYRIGGVRACPENAERLLSKEHLVVVFPEGVKGIGKYYHQRYKLQRFGRGGFIKLCIKTQSPLVPVGIVGAEEIHPILFKSNTLAKAIGIPYIPLTPTFPLMGLLGMIPLPSKWHIHFGPPIHFDQLGAEALQDEILIHKLSEKVRGQIQQILIEQLKKRRSVWRG
jgi:1-acyl-sn-glycerol-3-phosphate acyltransferase